MWGHALLMYTSKDDDSRDRLEEWVNATDPGELKEREQERRKALVAALGGRVMQA